MGPESEEERADAHDRSVTTIACLTARIERLAERRDRWVAVATEARIERDAAIARAEKAEAERDEARRVAAKLIDAVVDVLGAGTSPESAKTIAALRKACGVSDG